MLIADTSLFRMINGLAGRSAVLDRIGIFLADYLIWAMAAAVIVRVYLECRQSGRSGLVARLKRFLHPAPPGRVREAAVMAVRCLMASGLAAIGNYLFSLCWFRPRPFVSLRQVNQLVSESPGYKSFPSDHSSIAFALAFSVTYTYPKFGLALSALAALVAFGRVYVGVHYPADVIAGVAVGFLWAWLMRRAEIKGGCPARLGRFLSRIRMKKSEI